MNNNMCGVIMAGPEDGCTQSPKEGTGAKDDSGSHWVNQGENDATYENRKDWKNAWFEARLIYSLCCFGGI